MGKLGGLVIAVVIVSVACSAGSEASSDKKICAALASVGARSSDVEVRAAAAKIRGAGKPSDPALAAVQAKIDVVGGNQLAIGARFDDVTAACAKAKVAVSLPSSSP